MNPEPSETLSQSGKQFPVFPQAGNGKRLLNYCIDAIMVHSLVFGLLIARSVLHEFFPEFNAGTRMVTWLILSLYFFYFFVLECFFGRTLGKLLTNTLMVTESNLKPGIWRVFWRTIFRFFPFEPLSFLVGTNGEPGFHDTWSETKVVDTSKLPLVPYHPDIPRGGMNSEDHHTMRENVGY